MADGEAKDKIASIPDKFNDIVQDLFNIEVNFILRDNITAQKMPDPRHALLDIGKMYYAALRLMQFNHINFLRGQGVPIEETYDEPFDIIRREYGYYTEAEFEALGATTDNGSGTRSAASGRVAPLRMIVDPNVHEQLGGFVALDVLRNWADSYADDPGNHLYLTETQRSILPRIKDNSDLLKGLFSTICRRDAQLEADGLTQRLVDFLDKSREDDTVSLTPNTIVDLSKIENRERTVMLTNQYTRSELVSDDSIDPLPIDDSELVLIRKVWELGTEVIVMQTIIQVDGDVITRLNPTYMNQKKYSSMQQYHNDSVNIALRHWSGLVTVAQRLMQAIFEGLSR